MYLLWIIKLFNTVIINYIYLFLFIFLSTIFSFIFFHTQHNIISKIKQNKTADTFSTSQGSIKREGEREGQQEHKSHSFISYIQQKTLPSLNGWRPGPTDSRRCTFTWDNLQEATDPICLSTHVWCKPVLNYCLLHSCKTSKQHSLLHWTNTETRIIIKKT